MRRLYEFSIVVIIIAVLAYSGLRILSRAQGDAEEARMQVEVMGIRAQLLEVAVHRETFGGSFPQSDNPMDWIADRPAEYRGAFDFPPQENGCWYFDKGARELIYIFRDGHLARFRLSRQAGLAGGRGIPAGIGLLRVGKETGP